MNKKPIMTGHPLDDDGFVDHALNELSAITNKWNLVIESDTQGNTYLVFRNKAWKTEEKYKFVYNHENRRYV